MDLETKDILLDFEIFIRNYIMSGKKNWKFKLNKIRRKLELVQTE